VNASAPQRRFEPLLEAGRQLQLPHVCHEGQDPLSHAGLKGDLQLPEQTRKNEAGMGRDYPTTIPVIRRW
jgi:hypothetical protein